MRRRKPRLGGLNEILMRGAVRYEVFLDFFSHGTQFVARQQTIRHTRVRVRLRDSARGLYSSRHEWQRDRWIIELVVTESTVAHVIDDDVGLEFRAIISRQLHGSNDGVWIVAVDVYDRRAVRFCHIARVWTRTRPARNGGETDLVIHHDVHCSSRRVIRQILQLHDFCVLSEPTERCVAVK